MQPRIAIPFPYFDHAWSSRSLPQYVDAISLAGGEPLVIAHSATPALAAHLVKTCAAIVLPGSPADIDPQKYGEARDPRTAPADAARDMLDELLLQDAHAMRKPILGVCYGVQSLNVWRSGTLLQHIESEVLHQRPEGAPEGTVISHDAVVERKSRLGEILAGQIWRTPASQSGLAGDAALRLTVNSSHHQSVERPGDGFASSRVRRRMASSRPSRTPRRSTLSSAYSGTPSAATIRTPSRERFLPPWSRPRANGTSAWRGAATTSRRLLAAYNSHEKLLCPSHLICKEKWR